MAFMPSSNVAAGAFEGAPFSYDLSMATPSMPDVFPPGVEKAFAGQASCTPRPSMPTLIDGGPPGVMNPSSSNASPCMPNSSAHFDYVPPHSLQYGNTTLNVPQMPHQGMSSRLSTWTHSSFCHPPLPPHVPPQLPPPLPPPQISHMYAWSPSMVPRLGSLGKTVYMDVTQKLSMLDKQKLSIFVGKLLPSLDDDVVTTILKLCGSIKSWTRAKDPITGSPKGFGFCEYESPESLLRAMRLLNRFKLEGQELMLKVDQNTLHYLEQYVDEKIQTLKPQVDRDTESIPGLEFAHEAKQQILNVPAEVPLEERLGWVFEEENEIDKEVRGNLVKLVEQRNQVRAFDFPSGMANSAIDMDADTIKESAAEEDEQKVQLVKWMKFDYELEKCKLRGQQSRRRRGSDSFYLEYEKLWEERERAKEAQRKSEKERDEAIKKVRMRLIEKQAQSRTGLKGLCSNEMHKRRVVEKEKDDNDCILKQKNSIFTTSSEFKNMDSNYSPKEEALMESNISDLSTRAKVALHFKSSSKLKQSEQMQMNSPRHKSLWEENEDFVEGYKETKQAVSSLNCSAIVGNGNLLLQENPFGDGHKQQKHAVIGTSYRNPTFTCVRESTPEKQPPMSIKDVANLPVHNISQKVPERCKPLNAKELIDKLPTTKDEIFAFCMNWETFDKHSVHERLRPWVSKKISEFLGEEEATLVDFIIASAKKHMTPTHLLELLENIFVEEAELFVVKLWRVVIYEIRKAECGLT